MLALRMNSYLITGYPKVVSKSLCYHSVDKNELIVHFKRKVPTVIKVFDKNLVFYRALYFDLW